jgi:hypothetical protein
MFCRILLAIFILVNSTGVVQAARLQRCLEIGGEFASGKCRCHGIFVNESASDAARTCLAGVIELTSNSLQAVADIETAKNCGSHSVQFSQFNPNIMCPSSWLTISQVNKSGVIGGLTTSPSGTCQDQMTARAGGGKSSSEVSAILNQDPNTTLNSDPELWKNCFVGPHAATPESDKATTIAEHYYSMNRLKQAEISAIKALADADNLLEGENDQFWNQRNANCWDNHFPETVSICQAQAQCARSQENATKVYESTKKFLPDYAEFSSALKIQKYRNCINEEFADTTCEEDKNKQIEYLQAQMQMIESVYPIMKGQKLQSKLKSGMSDEEFKDAYKTQVRENRKEIFERLTKYKEAVKCLNSPASFNCTPGDIDKALALAPELEANEIEKYKTDEGKAQGIYINNLMGRAECLHSSRMNVKEGDKLVVKTSVDLVLALATAGAGAGIKALLEAKKLSTALSIYQKTSPLFKAMVLGAKTISAGSSALDTWKACETNLVGTMPPAGSPNECLNKNVTDEVLMAKDDMLKCSLAVFSAGVKLSKFVPANTIISKAATVVKDVEKLSTKLDTTLILAALSKLPAEKTKIVFAIKKATEVGLLRKLLIAGYNYSDSGKLEAHTKLVGQEIKELLSKEAIVVSDADSFLIGRELMGLTKVQQH